jgi:16S rRNA processing protein RimM
MEIGTIVSSQGVKGEVRIYPSTDFPQRFEKPGERWYITPQQPQTPQSIRLVRGYYLPHKNLYVVKFEGIDDRDAADAMRNYLLVVRDDDRSFLKPGEYHLRDLLGLPVYLQDTEELVGTAIDLVAAGSDLLVVKSATDDREIYIPFVPEIVPNIDFTRRRIEITPPPGLLSL